MLPILFQSSHFVLYSYPLLMGIGWGVAYQVFFNQLPRTLSIRQAQFLFWGLFVSSWIGAKFLFFLTYPHQISNDFISDLSFWTGGGLVFYGGFIASVVFLMVIKIAKFPLTHLTLWPLVPALAFGHGIGRLGCLLAGCCYGKETQWWWGIFIDGHYRHPTQLLEAIGLMGIGVYLLRSKAPKQFLINRYLVFYGLLRFIVEVFRGDEVRGSWGILSPSQWISIILVVTGCILSVKAKVSRS